MSKKRKPPAIDKDPRVIGLADCLAFALRAFRDKAVYDSATRKMEGWHAWFKRALREVGYGEFVDVLEKDYSKEAPPCP